jgi:putative transposase
MPRQPRVFVDGAYYHVYCRVGRGEPVFHGDEEAEALVEIIRDVKRRDGFAVLAWCVMSNHYHLALRCGRVPLWRTMRLIQGRYSKGFNRRHQVYGPVWQGRYKAKLLAGQGLRQLIAYIHLNPVAAGVARDPSRYRWSGHGEIVRNEPADLVDVDEALLAFGETVGSARRAYVHSVEAAAEEPWLRSEPGRLPWWKGGGGGAEAALSPGGPRLDALGASTAPERPQLTTDDYLIAAANALETGILALTGPRSGREVTRQREILALVGVETFGIKVKELAQQLGRNPGVVSRWANAGGERRAWDGEFRERAEHFEASVRASARPAPAERDEFVSGAGASFID